MCAHACGVLMFVSLFVLYACVTRVLVSLCHVSLSESEWSVLFELFVRGEQINKRTMQSWQTSQDTCTEGVVLAFCVSPETRVEWYLW